MERDSVFKVIEIAMDFLEFLMSTIPEVLVAHIEEMGHALLKHLQNKKDSISSKANDLLNLA